MNIFNLILFLSNNLLQLPFVFDFLVKMLFLETVELPKPNLYLFHNSLQVLEIFRLHSFPKARLIVFVQWHEFWFYASVSKGCQNWSDSSIRILKLWIKPLIYFLSPFLHANILFIRFLALLQFLFVIFRLFAAFFCLHDLDLKFLLLLD